MIQLYYKFSNNSWEDNGNFDYKVLETCQNKIPLNNLLDKRVKYRHKICETFMVKCFSFLQPMAGTHGIQHPSLISEKQKKSMSKKYKILEKSLVNNYIINLGYVLQNDENLSYIDAVHYSPETNKKIAVELLKYIFKV